MLQDRGCNEKLGTVLEEARQRLVVAQSRVIPEGVDSKTWKATVVTRMFDSKMKELERDIIQKNSSLSEVRLQMREANGKTRGHSESPANYRTRWSC